MRRTGPGCPCGSAYRLRCASRNAAAWCRVHAGRDVGDVARRRARSGRARRAGPDSVVLATGPAAPCGRRGSGACRRGGVDCRSDSSGRMFGRARDARPALRRRRGARTGRRPRAGSRPASRSGSIKRPAARRAPSGCGRAARGRRRRRRRRAWRRRARRSRSRTQSPCTRCRAEPGEAVMILPDRATACGAASVDKLVGRRSSAPPGWGGPGRRSARRPTTSCRSIAAVRARARRPAPR